MLHIPVLGVLFHMESGALKLLWTTFQIISSISFNLDVVFPEPYRTVTAWLSFVKLDFLSIACLNADYMLG